MSKPTLWGLPCDTRRPLSTVPWRRLGIDDHPQPRPGTGELRAIAAMLDRDGKPPRWDTAVPQRF